MAHSQAGIRIAGRSVSTDDPVFVIAEVGNNHDGSIGQALALIDAAAEAGVDAVKFQTHIAAAEMLPSTPTPPHFDEPRFSFTQRMQLSEDDHRRLMARAEERGLTFFSSPFSVEAVELLERVGAPAYKVASGEVTNPPLLDAIAATGKPVFVSTGMSGLEEVDLAVEILRREGRRARACCSAPPAIHVRSSRSTCGRWRCWQSATGVRSVCPDHTADIYSSIAAAALGAACVEKHFTLDHRLYGPDHKASLTPEAMAQLVRGVRQARLALGRPAKDRDPALDPVRATFEKSLVSATPIAEGATVTRSMLTTKRPGTGIPAASIDSMVGRRAVRDIPADELLKEGDLV